MDNYKTKFFVQTLYFNNFLINRGFFKNTYYNILDDYVSELHNMLSYDPRSIVKNLTYNDSSFFSCLKYAFTNPIQNSGESFKIYYRFQHLNFRLVFGSLL